MKATKLMTLAIALVFLIGGSAFAAPFNDRDPQISIGSPATGEDSLQAIFDTATNPADEVVDADEDQEEAAIWQRTDGDVDVWAITMFTAADGTLGIYSYSTGEEVDLMFLDSSIGGIGPGSDPATIDLAIYSSGVLEVGGAGSGDTYSGFGSFGFYWKLNDSTIRYTEDDKNAGGQAYALSYRLKEGSRVDVNAYDVFGDEISREFEYDNDDWFLAFEDYTDFDYNDAVFLLEDIEPVPEPATILLFGAGLLGLAAYGRKKGFRRS